ncbi:cytochrome P450 [Ophiocordyceps camponoti-floridani]|uniref:Cytochrome P450 n=1 Tax=Ophiocordyceps camponoti-floridani TaxID=2030778 RepID=A0A8H4QD42_9HYPO|nr:cytochrome P450 [Ophiocordyceps camponoti-floridani]
MDDSSTGTSGIAVWRGALSSASCGENDSTDLTMKTLVVMAGLGLTWAIYRYVSALRHSVAQARNSGLPYVVVPWHPIAWLSRLSHKIWVPMVQTLLPWSWWERWLDLMVPDIMFRSGFEHFKRHGDSFLVVWPGGHMLHTANAEMIRQMSQRREHFPKWTASYGILRLFGENVVTSEGSVWRTHRKMTSASFNERNTALVFREAVVQTQGMIRAWERRGQTALRCVDRDTMRLALNIIGYVGFGLRLLWPGQEVPPGLDSRQARYASLSPPEGHSLSFVDTMAGLMENLLPLLLLPRWILRTLPTTRKATVAYDNYVAYMDELLADKEQRLGQQQGEGGMDLMGSLVRTAYGTKNGLTRDDIIGNAFIMFLAGHETSANVLHFSMLHLAARPEAQRRLQRDIDRLVGDADPADWDYDELFNGMTASMIGACMNEELRIMPPATELPKKVTPTQDQDVTADGHRYVIPRDTIISLAVVSVQQNPRYWPHGESRVRPGCDDLRDFRPERWLLERQTGSPASPPSSPSPSSSLSSSSSSSPSGSASPPAQTTGPDADENLLTSSLFRPERGAYIPFSDGARSCLGRRIAQAEIMAALSVLFRQYSLELDVGEWADDTELEAMSKEDKRRVYGLAQKRSRLVMEEARTLVTLKLRGKQHVPLRMVPRGSERFVNWLEDEV